MVKLLLQELAQREEEVLFLQQKAHEDKVSGRKLGQRALADAADVPCSPLCMRTRVGPSRIGSGNTCPSRPRALYRGQVRRCHVRALAQIVDVVMYYRRFKHRVDLLAPWRGLKEARRMHRARDRSKAAAAAAAAGGFAAGRALLQARDRVILARRLG